MQRLEALLARSSAVDRYEGYYFRYFYSFGNKGMVFRTLATIYRAEGRYYWKNIEILRDQTTGRTTGLNKYEGLVFFLADRVYILDQGLDGTTRQGRCAAFQ